MEAKRFCVVCCVPFTKLRENGGHSEKLSASVLKIVEGMGGVNSKGLITPGGWEELVCVSCANFISSAVEGKVKVAGVDESVRRLQGEILRMRRKLVEMLGELEEALGSFRSARTGLDDILEESRGRVGMLDEFFGREERAEDKETRERMLQNAFEFRNRILNVMQELNAFTYDAQVKSEEPEVGKFIVGLSMETDDELISFLSPCSPGDDIVEEPEPSSTSQPQRRKRKSTNRERTTSARKRRRKQNLGEISGSETEDGGELTRYRKEKIRKAQQNAILDQLDRTAMTPFKYRMIRCVVRQTLREEKAQRQLKNEEYDPFDFLKNYKMTYDPVQDKILLGGIRIQINEQKEIMECFECGFNFPKHASDPTKKYRKAVYNHVCGFHLNLFQCPHCPSKHADYMHFQSHVKGHAGKFACDICGMSKFSCRLTLKQHKWTHMSQEEKEEAIRNGGKDVSGKGRYAKLKQAAGFQCATCGKKCLALAQLKYHEKSHLKGIVTCVCPHCGKGFKDDTYLRSHLRHSCPVAKDPKERKKDSRFQCDLCLKKFTFQHYLSHHKNMVHGNGARPFQCNVCKKRFKTEMALKVHMKSHSGLRPFKCPLCGVGFKTQQHRSIHEKTCEGNGSGVPVKPSVHSEACPFQCAECEAAFKTKKELREHKRTHSDERHFRCDKCQFRYRTERQLKSHLKRHSEEGERPFECAKCGVGFKTVQIRGRHERICETNATPVSNPVTNLFLKIN